MPPTLLSKPTPGAGPSDDGGGPSGALSQRRLVKLMAQFDLELKEMPKFGYKRMSFEDFLVVYAGWHLYAVCRRRVLPKEIQGITSILTDIDKSWENGTLLVTKLEDSTLNNKMSKLLNALMPEVKWTLTDRVDGLFRKLLENTKVRAIHLQLIGFTGRLTSLHFGNGGPIAPPTRPSISQQHLDDVQVYHLYALANWMKDSERKNITLDHTLGTFNTHYEFNIVPRYFAFFSNITDENHNLHKLVAAHIMDPTHRAFFGKKAFDSYKEYTKKNKLSLSEPLLVIPGVSQDQLESITNTNYDALISAATGSTSRQTIAEDPSQPTESNTPEPNPPSDLFSYNLAPPYPNFEDLFDYDAYETQDTEARPDSSGSGTKKVSVKGKEKAREYSSSPGNKGREGKKPRQ